MSQKKRELSKRAWKAIVSLEFDTLPVETWRGSVVGGSASVAASRALRETRKAYRGRSPRSYVLVLEAE